VTETAGSSTVFWAREDGYSRLVAFWAGLPDDASTTPKVEQVFC
jgi:hypothetical protein